MISSFVPVSLLLFFVLCTIPATTASECAPSFPSRDRFFDHYLPQMKRACGQVANCHGTSAEALTEHEYYLRLMKYVVPSTYHCSKPDSSCSAAWPVLADTMLSHQRLDNIRRLLLLVKERNLPGGFLEAGVWRGGGSIFARITMDNLGLADRHSYVCDSFAGLPAPRSELSAGEEFYQSIPYLAVSKDAVQHHFNMYCKLDESRVHFFKGYFVDSLPHVRKELQDTHRTLSVLRMDGDMYESTIDILYNLYDLVDVGGFIIIDDWGWTKNDWRAKDAVFDFRALHGIEDDDHAIFDIDGSGAYFRKARQITVKRDLYPKNVRPAAKGDPHSLRTRWEHILRSEPLHLGQTKQVNAESFLQASPKIKHPSGTCQPSFPTRAKFMTHYMEQMKRACAHATNCRTSTPELILEEEYYSRLIEHLNPVNSHCNRPNSGCNSDWPAFGDTMLGPKRLDNIRRLIMMVSDRNVPGDYLEAGVWRGGASVFARLVMDNLGQHDRHSYVCDSFAGLPPVRSALSAGEEFYHGIPYLAMPLETVRHTFDMYCKLDDTRVHFHKGYFVDSLPHVRKHLLATGRKISVLRMDGDMYESTIDILYNLYDLVSVGGFIIVDDWSWSADVWKAKHACLDFRAVHGIEDEDHAMFNVDNAGAYWRKAREVPLQRERYPNNVKPPRPANENALRQQWDYIALHRRDHLGHSANAVPKFMPYKDGEEAVKAPEAPKVTPVPAAAHEEAPANKPAEEKEEKQKEEPGTPQQEEVKPQTPAQPEEEPVAASKKEEQPVAVPVAVTKASKKAPAVVVVAASSSDKVVVAAPTVASPVVEEPVAAVSDISVGAQAISPTSSGATSTDNSYTTFLFVFFLLGLGLWIRIICRRRATFRPRQF